jgi:hypothetical protein
MTVQVVPAIHRKKPERAVEGVAPVQIASKNPPPRVVEVAKA